MKISNPGYFNNALQLEFKSQFSQLSLQMHLLYRFKLSIGEGEIVTGLRRNTNHAVATHGDTNI